MKIRNPIYLPYALIVAALVGYANYNGWSVLHAFAARSWMPSAPHTQHK
jgi:hypothetical protein